MQSNYYYKVLSVENCSEAVDKGQSYDWRFEYVKYKATPTMGCLQF